MLRISFFLVIVLFCRFSGLGAQGYDRGYFSVFPSYAAVVEHYVRTDTSFLREQAALFEWEKRVEGWYLLKRNPLKPAQALLYQLVWSAEKKDWMRPAVFALTAEQTRLLQRRIALNNQAHLYNICPVFGYEGYERDVLRRWQGMERDLTESECECLMQTYGALVYKHWLFDEGRSGRWSRFDSTFARADVPAAVLDTVQRLSERWHRASARLLEMRPEYLLGGASLQTKAQHDKLAAYHHFLIWGERERGRVFLESARYDTFLVSSALNALQSCPERSVLLVQGEQAFYPLLYAQERLKARPDVALVYLPFLNLGRYVRHLQREKGLEFALPLCHYQYQNGKMWRIAWDSLPGVWAKWAASLPKDGALQPGEYVLPAPIWMLGAEQQLRFEFKQTVCLQENVALLDLLHGQFGKRSLCLHADLQTLLDRSVLKEHTRLRGLVFEVVEQAEKGLPAGQFALDETALAKNLKHYDYALPSNGSWRYTEFQQTAHAYVSAYYQLASLYIARNGKGSPLTAELIDRLYRNLPLDRYWYGSGHLIFAFLMDDMGRFSEALQHIRGFARELEQKIRWMDLLPTEEQAARRQLLRQDAGMLFNTVQELQQSGNKAYAALGDLSQKWEAQFAVLFRE